MQGCLAHDLVSHISTPLMACPGMSVLAVKSRYYVSLHEMGRHIVFSSVVCLSVRLSVRHAFVSALYLSNPLWDLQITLHKCQV